jgi:hypothetical protein
MKHKTYSSVLVFAPMTIFLVLGTLSVPSVHAGGSIVLQSPFEGAYRVTEVNRVG